MLGDDLGAGPEDFGVDAVGGSLTQIGHWTAERVFRHRSVKGREREA